MTADQLRELADKLTDNDRPLTIEAQERAAAYLRACADAMEAGPLLWYDTEEERREDAVVFEGAELRHQDWMSDAWVPLYPFAMPAPTAQRTCGCRACLTTAQRLTTFVVCSECGNKRCPKADDHRNQCTGSNAPTQSVSVADELPPDRIEAIAHRAATFYRHDEARGHEYMFKRRELLDFAARLLAEAQPSSNACQLQSFGNSEQLALRLPEPMTHSELDAVLDDYGSGAGVRHYELCRWIEAETLRRVREANNG